MLRSIEHGSAGFMEVDGRALVDLPGRYINLWLGHPVRNYTTGKGVHVRRGRAIVAEPHRHMLTIAPTRSGKGTAAIIPNLLAYPGSVFVIDPKGENAWVTAERRRQMGQEVFVLDPWGEVAKRYGDEPTARFNPLAGLDPASLDFTDDLAGLADAIIINQGKDPHWDDSARELVAGLIALLIEDPETRPDATLGQMRALVTLPRAQIVELVRTATARGGVAARKLGRFAQDTNEISSIISTAVTQTAFLDNDALNAAMAVSEIDFARLANGNVSIYLVIPADKLGPYGRWLRLLVTIAIRALARAQRPRHKVLCLLDEFGTIGSLAAVEQAFGLMGGMGICLWPFVQDLNQLKRDYPDSWETFVANAEVVQAFGVKDNFSSEYLSQLLGVTTEESISVATARKRRGDLFNAAEPTYRSMQDRTFQRSLMFPDEIRSLRPDWQLLIYRGKPVMAALMPYHQTSAFNGLYRPLPGFKARDARLPWPHISFDPVNFIRQSVRTGLVTGAMILATVALGIVANEPLGLFWSELLLPLLWITIACVALLHFTHDLWRDYAGRTRFGVVFQAFVDGASRATRFVNGITGWGIMRTISTVISLFGAIIILALVLKP